jgi:K+-sensing histidine kinase KdpD
MNASLIEKGFELDRQPFFFSLAFLLNAILALLLVAGFTAAMALIGGAVLGQAVIALLYLLPIGWSTARWGQGVGIVSAVAAAAAFDFFFIPPYYTFTVGSLEGWLVLGIFLAVAIAIVGRIQSGLNLAKTREKEAIFMYELSSALAGQLTQEGVAHVLAERLQQLFLASQVEVRVFNEDGTPALTTYLPVGAAASTQADRDIPLIASRAVEGEICIWRGRLALPPVSSRLLTAYSTQGALALERTRFLNQKLSVIHSQE